MSTGHPGVILAPLMGAMIASEIDRVFA